MGGTNGVGGNNNNNRVGQTNNLTDIRVRSRNVAQSTALETAPLAADKQFGANFLGSFNRARLEQKFSQQQQQIQPDNNEIGGITTRTDFPMKIAKTETQESVLKRAFGEMARKAGISEETIEGTNTNAVESFVNDRMEANKPAKEDGNKVTQVNKAPDGDKVRILNSQTGQPYSDKEWAKFQKSGTITMYPSDEDIAVLKSFKNTGGDTPDFKAGQAAADVLMKAVNEGFSIWNYQPLSPDTVPPAVADALEIINSQQNNGDFQEGLLDRLGADNFLKAEKYLNGTAYQSVMKNSLSVASQNQGSIVRDKTNEKGLNIRQQIAQKADVETLARLTSDADKPMSGDFLVEAGKRVVKEGLQYREISRTDNSRIVPIADPNAAKVLQTIAQNPELSLKLMQNPNFVRDAAKFSAVNGSNSGFGDIMKAATSYEMRSKGEGNDKLIDNAIKNIAEVYSDADAIAPKYKSNGMDAPYRHYISESDSQALAEVYRNNAPVFTTAVHRSENNEGFDRTDVIAFFTAVSQSDKAKQNATVTTQAEFERLVRSYPNGDPSGMSRAGDIVGTFADTVARTEINVGEKEDKQKEREAQIYASIIGGFGNTPTSMLHLPDPFAIVIATTTNLAANEVSNSIKTDKAEQARIKAGNNYQELRTQVRVAVLSSFEEDASAIVSGQKTASPQQRQKAEEFLTALKSFNDELPENSKIIEDGRLISASRATKNQINYMEDAVSGDSDSSVNNQVKAKKAAETIQIQTSKAYESLKIAVMDNFKQQ